MNDILSTMLLCKWSSHTKCSRTNKYKETERNTAEREISLVGHQTSRVCLLNHIHVYDFLIACRYLSFILFYSIESCNLQFFSFVLPTISTSYSSPITPIQTLPNRPSPRPTPIASTIVTTRHRGAFRLKGEEGEGVRGMRKGRTS